MLFWIIYVVFGITHVVLEYFDQSLIAMPFKVFLLPVLMLAFRYAFKTPLTTVMKAVLVAQLFSWFGDILLINSGVPAFFLSGLVVFLIGHLAYIVAFRIEIGGKPRVSPILNDPWMALPFIAFGVGIMWWMWDGLEDMRWPVVAYTTIIITMLGFAFSRWKLVPPASFWPVFIGAALFVLSDSMIAVNKFISPFEGSRVAIMGTYIAAQFLIAWGMVKGLGGKISS
jgi:uncharacterized membrane protein YhhN